MGWTQLEREENHMLRTSLVVAMCGFLFTTAGARAQNVCATSISSRLVCKVPEVYGPTGLVLPAGVGPPALVGSFNGNNLSPLNTAVATQSVLLSLASPAAGIVYAYDPTTQIFAPSTDSFGPVFGERADTVGKHRFFVGESYQYFNFSSLDGSDLKHLPQVFTQPDTPLSDGSGRICSTTGDSVGGCSFIRDVVTVDTRVDLKIHQAVTFLTFGITDRVDVSMAIPLESVRFAITSNATIVDNSGSRTHSFALRPGCGSIADSTNCTNQSFPTAGGEAGKAGIGDLVFRAKGTVWRGEHAALAVGGDVRMPTGDSLNFLGSGAWGFRPFAVWSYRSRISPHLGGGYQVNGNSKLVGDLSTASEARLPRQFTYSAGADAWLTKRITAAFDFVGQTVFNTQRLIPTNFTELGACVYNNGNIYPDCNPPDASFAPPKVHANVAQSTANVNALNASLGVKLKLVSTLLFTGNATFKINSDGLRARVVPMAELSFTF
jgi:hypothetical protein